MRIGNREFLTGEHTYVWGILNVTPDSFSDGGKYTGDAVLFRVEDMIREGAGLIDIGGQSTRPGYVEISEQEEIERTASVIKSIKDRFDIPVSIDTYSAAVALAALKEGADLINDIWGLKKDENLAVLAAQYDAAICLMHNREAGAEQYDNILEDITGDLEESVRIALSKGVKKEKIILDPGIGFAKNYSQNLFILNNLSELKKSGYPMLLGASKKSVIGETLSLPVGERGEGTIVTTVLAVQAGYEFVRVHDVKENVRAVKMMEKIKGSKGGGR